MKNVAKCDTWCELQNPVNHRVFERKLRPRPSGQGHACLGVTPPVAPRNLIRARMRRLAHRAPCAAGRSAGRRRAGRGEWWTRFVVPTLRAPTLTATCRRRTPYRGALASLGTRPQVRRGYPLSLSISISGGEETYKDSPSNGERTGNSPALESGGFAVRIVVWRSVLCGGPGPSPLERGAREGESPVVPGPCRTTRRCRRVGLFGNAAPIGR